MNYKKYEIEKCISKSMAGILLIFALVVVCPCFIIICSASSPSEDASWNTGGGSLELYYCDLGRNMRNIPLNFEINKLIATYSVADQFNLGGRLAVSYSPFTFTLNLGRKGYNGSSYFDCGDSLLGDIHLYIVDNLNNKYLLDVINGGSFVIEDTTNITSLSVCVLGTVSGTLSSPVDVRYIKLSSALSPLSISLSMSASPDPDKTKEPEDNPSVSGNDTNKEDKPENPSVSGGDSSEQNPEQKPPDFPGTIEVKVTYPEAVPLWNSNINDYNVTEGLLLCILVVLLFNILLQNFRRK